MDHLRRRRRRRQLNDRVPVTVANGGFGRTSGGTVRSCTGTGRVASSVRACNSGTGATAIGSDIAGTCGGSGTATETLVRRRREICWVLWSGHIFA